jgi:predicted ABC-type ATPase
MPNVYVIGGPNGAGKTTAALRILPELVNCREFVNADQIARGLSAFRPESASFEAGRLMLNRLDELSKNGVNFAFESTLASRTFGPRLTALQRSGYGVHLHFMWIESVDLALARIKARVRGGGHNIPAEVVVRRYHRSRQNFLSTYSRLADSWKLYDNSHEAPKLVASGSRAEHLQIWNTAYWTRFFNL